MLDVSKNSICLFNLFIMFLTVLFKQFKFISILDFINSKEKKVKRKLSIITSYLTVFLKKRPRFKQIGNIISLYFIKWTGFNLIN